MKFWPSLTTKVDQWYFGVTPIRRVCTARHDRSRTRLTKHPGRANAACILACYMVLIQSWPPHLALAPIAQIDPPLMPFRDAGYSQADYTLTVQDIVYGVWKAKEEGICGLKEFNLEEYVFDLLVCRSCAYFDFQI